MGILSQEELNQYIRRLSPKEQCVFMINNVIALCDSNFICPYKAKETFSFRGTEKRECKREKILRYKKLLGDKL